MTARIEVSGELMDTPRAMTIGGDSVIWTAVRVRMPAVLAFPDRGASWRCFRWPVVVSVRSWPASVRVTWCGCRGASGERAPRVVGGHPSIASNDSEFARAIRMIFSARSGILFLISCLAGVSMQQCRVFLSRDADESA